MQSFGFSFPLTVSTLVAYIVLFFVQGYENTKDIVAIGHLFYLEKPQGKQLSSIRNQSTDYFLALGSKLLIISLIGFLLLWLSKMKITGHVWFPTSERLAMIYKLLWKFCCYFFYFGLKFCIFLRRLFVLPYYESAIVEQNLLLNKQHRDEIEMKGKEKKLEFLVIVFHSNLYFDFLTRSS